MLKFLGKGVEAILGVFWFFLLTSPRSGNRVPTVRYISPSYALENWKMGLWTQRTHVEWTWARTLFIDGLAFISCHLELLDGIWGPVFHCQLRPYIRLSLEGLGVPFSFCTVTLVNRFWRMFVAYTYYGSVGSFLKRNEPPSN